MIINEELQIFSELSQERVNRERFREVEYKNCKRIVSTWMRAPKCMICKHEMITIIKTK